MELIDLKKDLRADFPALNKKILDKNLIYFDTAASAQKPQSVIDELSSFYSNHYSNVRMLEKKFKNLLMLSQKMKLFLQKMLLKVLI